MLFASLGGVTWAVRGCSGFGTVAGCVVASVAWVAAWWFLAQGLGGEPADCDPALERLGLSLGLLTGLGLSARNGLKGCCNIYLGGERYWERRLWEVLGPVLLAGLVAIALEFLVRPSPRRPPGRKVVHAYGLTWLVLVVQNAIALLVTGPPTVWNEVAFGVYIFSPVSPERDRRVPLREAAVVTPDAFPEGSHDHAAAGYHATPSGGGPIASSCGGPGPTCSALSSNSGGLP